MSIQHRVVRSSRVVFVIVLALLRTIATAQDLPPRTYLPDPADEDWSFLKDAPKTDAWDPIKYVPLGRDDWFMTLSGEIRYRAEGFRVRATEPRAAIIDNYLLQRYLFGADVRTGKRVRVFAELQSGIINGRVRSPRPTDGNRLDLHQGFLEWRSSATGQRRVSVRVGRQALAIGSTRLISASPGLNVKRSFDGVAVGHGSRSSWMLSGAVARLVGLEGGVFDDRSDSTQLFWGVAAARRSPWLPNGDVGGYYLGLDRDQSLYAQGIAAERRHTAGIKWAASGSRVALNYDALLQWGSFGPGSIRAWAFATETAYQLSTTGWSPRLNLRADVATGDADPAKPDLQAFNPLFPGNAFSGVVGLLGPTNLTDLTPGVTMKPRPGLVFGLEAPSYWRTSTDDGVYATDLRLLIRPDVGEGRYVGTNPGVHLVWQATRHCQVQAVVTRFLPGAFLKETFFSSGFGFYSGTVRYRF